MEQALAQLAHWVLWTPAAFSAGTAIYFAVKAEPSAIVIGAAVFAAVALAAAPNLLGRRLGLFAPTMLLAASLFGFADEALSTWTCRAPVMPETLGVAEVRGWVVDVASASSERARLLIAPQEISGMSRAALPARVRLIPRGTVGCPTGRRDRGAGDPGPAAGAGQSGRLRLRPGRLVRAAGRGRSRARSAAGGRAGAARSRPASGNGAERPALAVDRAAGDRSGARWRRP